MVCLLMRVTCNAQLNGAQSAGQRSSLVAHALSQTPFLHKRMLARFLFFSVSLPWQDHDDAILNITLRPALNKQFHW